MSREHKYRAFDRKDPILGMLKVIALDWDDKCNVMEVEKGNGDRYSGAIEQFFLMQYIGIEDKDRVEICEGDVAEVQVGMDIYKRYVVEFDKRAYYKLQSKSEKHQDGTFKSLDFCEVEDCEIEVIGNIHQHPNLI